MKRLFSRLRASPLMLALLSLGVSAGAVCAAVAAEAVPVITGWAS